MQDSFCHFAVGLVAAMPNMFVADSCLLHHENSYNCSLLADEAKVLVPVCVDHGEKALLYCFQHSSLICLLCKDSGLHKTCAHSL